MVEERHAREGEEREREREVQRGSERPREALEVGWR